MGPGERGESTRGGATEFGPESWDQRVGRVGTRSWYRELGPGVGTRQLGLENWDLRVGTIELGESGPGVGDGTRQLGPESWQSWDQDLGPENWESWDKKVGSAS